GAPDPAAPALAGAGLGVLPRRRVRRAHPAGDPDPQECALRHRARPSRRPTQTHWLTSTCGTVTFWFRRLPIRPCGLPFTMWTPKKEGGPDAPAFAEGYRRSSWAVLIPLGGDTCELPLARQRSPRSVLSRSR